MSEHRHPRRKNRIAGQFSPRSIEMMESPAFEVLSLGAHRILARLEIELAHHGGNDNGRLPVTYDQFVEYGVRRHAIRPAIGELEALGFIEVTEHGRAGNAEWRRPNKFRLTYRHVGNAKPTDQWRNVRTKHDAEMLVRRAGKPVIRAGNQNRTPVTLNDSFQCRKRHQEPGFHSVESVTTSHSAETVTTSRFSGKPAGRASSSAAQPMQQYAGQGGGRYVLSDDPRAYQQYATITPSSLRFVVEETVTTVAGED